MQFLSGVGELGSKPVKPVDLEALSAFLDAQRARDVARLKANVDKAMERTPPPFDTARRALEQRLMEQMAARKAAAVAAKNKKLAIGAVVALGAAFLLLQK